MAVLCPLVAFASASDGWYVLSLTQEIRFASVVKPVTVFGSLVALASVSDRWYALSVTQEIDLLLSVVMPVIVSDLLVACLSV